MLRVRFREVRRSRFFVVHGIRPASAATEVSSQKKQFDDHSIDRPTRTRLNLKSCSMFFFFSISKFPNFQFYLVHFYLYVSFFLFLPATLGGKFGNFGNLEQKKKRLVEIGKRVEHNLLFAVLERIRRVIHVLCLVEN